MSSDTPFLPSIMDVLENVYDLIENFDKDFFVYEEPAQGDAACTRMMPKSPHILDWLRWEGGNEDDGEVAHNVTGDVDGDEEVIHEEEVRAHLAKFFLFYYN